MFNIWIPSSNINYLNYTTWHVQPKGFWNKCVSVLAAQVFLHQQHGWHCLDLLIYVWICQFNLPHLCTHGKMFHSHTKVLPHVKPMAFDSFTCWKMHSPKWLLNIMVHRCTFKCFPLEAAFAFLFHAFPQITMASSLCKTWLEAPNQLLMWTSNVSQQLQFGLAPSK